MCETEEERVAALEVYFGIRLTRDERRGIEGLPSALPGDRLICFLLGQTELC